VSENDRSLFVHNNMVNIWPVKMVIEPQDVTGDFPGTWSSCGQPLVTVNKPVGQ